MTNYRIWVKIRGVAGVAVAIVIPCIGLSFRLCLRRQVQPVPM